MIDLMGKNIVIAGGGPIATRKLESVINTGANITVVSLTFSNTMQSYASLGKVRLLQKKVEKQDIEHAFLIIAATDDGEVNKWLKTIALPHQLVNVASQVEKGNTIMPAHISRGDLSIAVTTNGASPSLTKKIKNELNEQYDESYVQYVSFLKRARTRIRQLDISPEKQKTYLQESLQEKYKESQEEQAVFYAKLLSYACKGEIV
jgi:precorrin-2 dehydrogenase/sirohydrochlorin ferrochelatase